MTPKLFLVLVRMALAMGVLLMFTVMGAAQSSVTVTMRDACDPDTFNAVVGPGTCIAGQHGTTVFDLFIGEVASDHMAGAWRFNPLLNASGDVFSLVTLNLTAGQQIQIQNLGGETHTFTRVKKFGGGVVPPLNTLSGNPVVAPECLQPESDRNVVVEAGTSQSGPTAGTSALPEEVTKWQCCIHPWMRMRVSVNQGQQGQQGQQ
jgi:hypothetical protein